MMDPSPEVGGYRNTQKRESRGTIMEFKYYVVYGNPTFTLGQPAEARKAFEKFGKAVEKHNLKLVFWGGAYGVSEGAMYVLKGKIEDYEKLEGDLEVFPLRPLRNTRTNFVFEL